MKLGARHRMLGKSGPWPISDVLIWRLCEALPRILTGNGDFFE